MSILSLFKGVRLPRCPELPSLRSLSPPEKVVLPLRQHQGRVCEPVVEAGQEVLLGQVVGSSQEFEAAVVHATVSGKVEAVTETYDPAGQRVPAVVIANDGRDAWLEPEEAPSSWEGVEAVQKARPTRLLKRLREAGLVRSGLLGLPLHVDLSPPMAPRSYMFMTGIPVVRPVDTLIVKAVDHDPPVITNQAALAEAGEDLALGVAALARICGARRVVLVLPVGVRTAEVEELAARQEWEISRQDPRRFPYAVDNLLVKALTGRVVPTPYGEPREVGVVVEPLVTALEVGRVLRQGRPPVERLFTVAGDVSQPGVFRVRLGTPIAQVIEAAGGLPAEPGKVILGGPMMGYAHFDLQTPVTKETDGLVVQAAGSVQTFQNQPCIHCGRCVAVCPVGLVPAELGKLCEYGQFEDAVDRDLMHCIECGCCAYVCPARRPMVHLLRFGKSEVLARRMEQ